MYIFSHILAFFKSFCGPRNQVKQDKTVTDDSGTVVDVAQPSDGRMTAQAAPRITVR